MRISFREAVYFEGKKSLDSEKDKVTLAFHPAGVRIQSATKTVIVPFENCLWIQVEG